MKQIEQAFWLVLVLVAAGLISFYVYVQYQAELAKDRIYVEHDTIVITSASLAQKFEQALKSHLEQSGLILTATSLDQLEPHITQEISNAFAVTYAQIPKLADFHYSIVGSYSQLLAILMNQGDKDMMTILFNEVEFDTRLKTAFANITANSHASLGHSLAKLDNQAQIDLNLSSGEINLINNVLQFTQDDIIQRFDLSLNSLRVGGIGLAGAGIGIIAQRVARVANQKIAARMATIAAAKTATKVSTSSSGGKTGAVVGGTVGSAVPVVGTAAGAVVGAAAGAIIGWVGSEQAITKVDEYLHRAEFEAEIKTILDQMQQELKLAIYHQYEDIFNDIGSARAAAFKSQITTKELIQASN